MKDEMQELADKIKERISELNILLDAAKLVGLSITLTPRFTSSQELVGTIHGAEDMNFTSTIQIIKDI